MISTSRFRLGRWRGIASKVVHSPDRPFASSDGLERWNTDRNKLHSRGSRSMLPAGAHTHTRNFTSDFASRSESRRSKRSIEPPLLLTSFQNTLSKENFFSIVCFLRLETVEKTKIRSNRKNARKNIRVKVDLPGYK